MPSLSLLPGLLKTLNPKPFTIGVPPLLHETNVANDGRRQAGDPARLQLTELSPSRRLLLSGLRRRVEGSRLGCEAGPRLLHLDSGQGSES